MRINRSRKYVNNIVNGGSASLQVYKRLADGLGVPLAALFDGYPLDLL